MNINLIKHNLDYLSAISAIQ